MMVPGECVVSLLHPLTSLPLSGLRHLRILIMVKLRVKDLLKEGLWWVGVYYLEACPRGGAPFAME